MKKPVFPPKPVFPLLKEAAAKTKTAVSQLDEKPWETSHLPAGRHCAFFEHGGGLYFEMDRAFLARARDDVKDVINDAVDAMKTFGVNHPILAGIAVLLGVGGGAAPGILIEKYFEFNSSLRPVVHGLAQAFPTATSYLTLAGVVILIELIILVVRAIEIKLNDVHSRHGGVVIKLVFPNFQVLSRVYPRGGLKPAADD